MDPKSVERYTELAKRLNIPPGEMVAFIRSICKEEREDGSCSVSKRKKISWKKNA